MQYLARAAATLALFCCASWLAPAQTPASKEPPGTIAGRVTHDEKGAPNIAVAVLPADFGRGRERPVAKARTDADGHYRLTGLPPGRYAVVPLAHGYVMPDLFRWPPGTPVHLGAGETVEDIDFTLTRGGVVTGRVTGADGRPVIGEPVSLVPVVDEGAGGTRPRVVPPNQAGGATDDRGTYRLYGVPAGRYRVRVGTDWRGPVSRRRYPQTFHPGTTNEAQARIVEVTPGGEATDVDITVGEVAKTYKVSGRVVDAESGLPAANVMVRVGPLSAGGQWAGSLHLGATSNSRGEFQVEVTRGNFGAIVLSEGRTDLYSDMTTFEVTDADVENVEVRLRRGASISGVVSIEGNVGRGTPARGLAELTLYAGPDRREGVAVPFVNQSGVAADGTFRIAGLRPGRVRIMPDWSQARGLTLLRVERNGVEQREGIEVAAGEQVTGVRVVFAYGTGTIRGQVRVENGTLPQGAAMMVLARRVGAEPSGHFSPVDARGRFAIEHLPLGEYVLRLDMHGEGAARPESPVTQRVTVGDAGETLVTFVLDLGRKAVENE